MRVDKEKLFQLWYKLYEEESIKLGLPEAVINDCEGRYSSVDNNFWSAGNYYRRWNYTPQQAAKLTYDSYLRNYVKKET